MLPHEKPSQQLRVPWHRFYKFLELCGRDEQDTLSAGVGVQLGWDLVIVKAITCDLNNFHIYEIIQCAITPTVFVVSKSNQTLY